MSATIADGTYSTGELIIIIVTFSEPVIVTGNPQLWLETGEVDAIAPYTSGSGTINLAFSYTVADGDISSDLDYTGVNTLSLNGGAINDTGGTVAVLALPPPGSPGSLGANKNIVISTLPDPSVGLLRG